MKIPVRLFWDLKYTKKRSKRCFWSSSRVHASSTERISKINFQEFFRACGVLSSLFFFNWNFWTTTWHPYFLCTKFAIFNMLREKTNVHKLWWLKYEHPTGLTREFLLERWNTFILCSELIFQFSMKLIVLTFRKRAPPVLNWPDARLPDGAFESWYVIFSLFLFWSTFGQ